MPQYVYPEPMNKPYRIIKRPNGDPASKPEWEFLVNSPDRDCLRKLLEQHGHTKHIEIHEIKGMPLSVFEWVLAEPGSFPQLEKDEV